MIEYIDIKLLKQNEANPRFINQEKLDDLKYSIRNFEDMMKIRPVIIDEDNIILGGNMRYKASLSLGLTQIPVKRINGLTDEEKKEFIIKDNIHAGLWDAEKLDAWDKEKIEEWGLYYDPIRISDEELNSHFINKDDEGGYQGYIDEDKKILKLTYNEDMAQRVIEGLLDNGSTKEEGLKNLLDI